MKVPQRNSQQPQQTNQKRSKTRSAYARTNSMRKEAGRTATNSKIGTARKNRSRSRNSKPPPPDLCTHSRQEGRQASGPLRGLFMYAERFIHFNRRFESGGVVSGTCRSQILPVSAVIPTGAVLCCLLQSSAPNSKCRLGNYT